MNEYLFLPDSGQSCLNFEGGKDANPDGIHACQAASKTQKGVRIGSKNRRFNAFLFHQRWRSVPPFSKLCRPSILSRTRPAQLCIYLPFYSMLYSFFPPSPVIRYILSPLLPPFCAAADRLFPPLPEILMKASKGRRGKGRKSTRKGEKRQNAEFVCPRHRRARAEGGGTKRNELKRTFFETFLSFLLPDDIRFSLIFLDSPFSPLLLLLFPGIRRRRTQTKKYGFLRTL